MRIITLLLTLALAIGIHAAVIARLLDSDLATIPNVDFAPADYNGTASAGDNVADFPGQYKFLDGTTQNLLEAGEFCNYMTYEEGQWKGYLGKWNGARVNDGFICYFYTEPCDPGKGYAEPWAGWWKGLSVLPDEGFAYSPEHPFKGYYCRRR